MTTLEISRPHHTTLEDASRRAREMLERFAASSPGLIEQVDWPSEQHAVAKGMGFSGSISIDEVKVLVSARLSFPATLIRARIEKEIAGLLAREFRSD
jgi:hypothetical protein